MQLNHIILAILKYNYIGQISTLNELKEKNILILLNMYFKIFIYKFMPQNVDTSLLCSQFICGAMKLLNNCCRQSCLPHWALLATFQCHTSKVSEGVAQRNSL